MKRTVINMLNNACEKYKDSAYLCEKSDNGYYSRSYIDVNNESNYVAAKLLETGFAKNDKIAILSDGRIDWVIGEYGITKAGCIAVPLSVKLLPEEILFRLNHSESKAILISINNIFKLYSIWDKIDCNSFKIIYLDNDLESIKEKLGYYKISLDSILLINEIKKEGKLLYESNPKLVKASIELIEEDDIVTISYTSGTTGNPKGIMLTQLNYVSNSTDAMEFFNVKVKDRLFIVLPIDHAFAHTVGVYASLVRGLAIFFVDSRGGALATLKNIPINMLEVNPHFMLTVPALTGNLMTKITDNIKAKGRILYGLFNLGLRAGMKINGDGFHKLTGIKKLPYSIIHSFVDMLIFKKIRKIFGTSMRYCVGGGALLDIRQQKFFYTIGIPIYQGYGLTEAAPIISANTPAVHKLGSSGRVLTTIEHKIINADGTTAPKGEKGELVIKGNNVMKGYYKNDQASKEVLKDGWLHTGDLGLIEKDDFLMIYGREKALLISQDGEKYSPEEIEEAIVNCSYLVSQVMIHNDHNKYTTAIITIQEQHAEQYIKKHHIKNPEKFLESLKHSFYEFKHDENYKGKFPDKWIPSTFSIAEEQFSEKNNMINSTLKMVRHKIREVYKDRIELMYKPEGNNCINPVNIEIVRKMFFKE